MTDPLKASDEAAAAVAVAPRVTLKDIEAAIADEFYMDGETYLRHSMFTHGMHARGDQDIDLRHRGITPPGHLTICLMVMKNGFTVIGKSAPASPENFDASLGRQFAREDCIRQLWPLMGFALRDRLHTEANTDSE